MRLIVTEKPSVAAAICKALGIVEDKKHSGYIEGRDTMATWCLGHLVEMAPPEAYDEKYRKWSVETLPVIPVEWKFQVKEARKKQFSVVKRLLNDKRVDEIVCATDAGAEGELIFRLVYLEAGCRKSFKRLWISSMEEDAIKHGMESLLPGDRYNDLYEAALCRAKADWLIGMNGTRYFTAVYRGKVKKVGRVQTPTLAMIEERDKEIREFVSVPYYTVELEKDGMVIRSDRFESREEAEEVLNSCRDAEIKVTSVVKKEVRTAKPKLFDLTSLQREANRVFGFTAKQTLDYLQSLYEEKLTTYPRTDSRYLTDDMISSMANRLSIVRMKTGMGDEKPDINAVLNSSRVTDHHAIIITCEVLKADFNTIPESERKILELVMVRMAEATSRDAVTVKTDIGLECAGTGFHTTIEETVQAGFREYTDRFRSKYGKERASKDNGFEVCRADTGYTPSGRVIANPATYPLREQLCLTGSMLPAGWEGRIRKDATKAPACFTESTLLGAMEKAGADETCKEAERTGLGTPATRADIIEKLIHDGYVMRTGKKLSVTDEGRKLVALLPSRIKSASYTAEWANRLAEIAAGKREAGDFMKSIENEVRQMVSGNEGER